MQKCPGNIHNLPRTDASSPMPHTARRDHCTIRRFIAKLVETMAKTPRSLHSLSRSGSLPFAGTTADKPHANEVTHTSSANVPAAATPAPAATAPASSVPVAVSVPAAAVYEPTLTALHRIEEATDALNGRYFEINCDEIVINTPKSG